MDKATEGSRRKRRSIRLKDWDYTQPGPYFVTICTHERANLFGEVVDGEMALNERGRIVEEEWLRTAELRAYVELDEFVVMPNHVHGIIVLGERDDAGGGGAMHPGGTTRRRGTMHRAPTRRREFGRSIAGSLPTIVGAFKAAVTRQANRRGLIEKGRLWQRGYYERIVRDERELNAIREYIGDNPLRWAEDRENLEALVARMRWVDYAG